MAWWRKRSIETRRRTFTHSCFFLLLLLLCCCPFSLHFFLHFDLHSIHFHISAFFCCAFLFISYTHTLNSTAVWMSFCLLNSYVVRHSNIPTEVFSGLFLSHLNGVQKCVCSQVCVVCLSGFPHKSWQSLMAFLACMSEYPSLPNMAYIYVMLVSIYSKCTCVCVCVCVLLCLPLRLFLISILSMDHVRRSSEIDIQFKFTRQWCKSVRSNTKKRSTYIPDLIIRQQIKFIENIIEMRRAREDENESGSGKSTEEAKIHRI